METKETFGSKLALVAATVGSAVGLGNVWRFPAETQANGGAAFLLVYILCVFLLGIPVMLGEFSLGRGIREDAVGVYRRLSGNTPWRFAGVLPILASYIILSFYIVVAGWTLEYFFFSVTGDLYSPSNAVTAMPWSTACETQFKGKMIEYILTDIKPIVFTFIVILMNLFILIKGVKKGIGKISNILLPVLFVLLLLFCCVSLSLPGAMEGLQFFLAPDFSKITPMVIVNALGQAFFSLSLGMGVLITYSSYFPKDTKLTSTAVTVSTLDLLVAMLMGVIIFPAVTSFGLMDSDLEGTTLVFITLPEVFAQMEFSEFWSALFFLLLFIAALTSTISIAEVTIKFFEDRFKMNRKKACMLVLLPLFLFSAISSLSLGSLSGIKVFGMTIFDALDFCASNIMLPVGAIIMSLFIGWHLDKNVLKEELTNHGEIKSYIYPYVAFILKWIAPILIVLVLISPLLK